MPPIPQSRAFMTTACHFLLIAVVVNTMTNDLSSAEEPDVITLEPVVVSASAYPMSLENTPASITIITRKEIEQKQAESLTDLLRQVPGLFMDQMGTRGG